MLPIKYLDWDILKNIKLIVFDVDGVMVPRGTKIRQIDNLTTFETKRIAQKQIEQIKKLNELKFLINISSGRGLYMLQEMFREILPFTSLTYEHGSATWYQGKIHQHINSFEYLHKVLQELKNIQHENIKGFEPKEFIITIHSEDRVEEIEKLLTEKYPYLYCLWNGEAYDIGMNEQHKATGLTALRKIFGLEKENVLAIGDNYNDKELLDAAGIAVSADKTRVNGHFYVPLEGEILPAERLMEHIIRICSDNE
jgi:HAD superfamily hydrolase (TIGR01484 family)